MPISDELTTWVVDTGAPTIEAPKMTAADVSWPSKAWRKQWSAPWPVSRPERT